MSEIHDLDAVVAEDLRVKLGGQTWRLPGDPPSELLLRIIHLQQQLGKAANEAQNQPTNATEDEQAEMTETLLAIREQIAEQLGELFAMRNQDFEPGTLQMSDAQVVSLVNFLFEQYNADEEGGDRPTPTPPKPRSAQPSRRNSGRSKPRSRSSASSLS